MRYRILLVTWILASSMHGWGQEGNVFQRFSLSGGIGSTGLTMDMGTMMTDHFGLRAGVDLLSLYQYGSNEEIDLNNELYQLDPDITPLPYCTFDTHLTNSAGHLLMDYYPFSPAASGFHVTVGAYWAWHRNVETRGTDDDQWWRRIADFNARRGNYADVPDALGQVTIDFAGYDLRPAADGTLNAYMRANRFRPYLGIGFGRAVPGARRLNVQFDLGVQFWGRPRVYDGTTGERLTRVKNISHGGLGRSTVYPVITIRLAGRILGCPPK